MLTHIAPALPLLLLALVILLAIRNAMAKPTSNCIDRANAYLQATETEREVMQRERRTEMGLK